MPLDANDDPEVTTESHLGLRLPMIRALGSTIGNDLVDELPYGIGWWQPNCDELRPQRIMVSDHLVACCASIPRHLVIAKYRWLEFQAFMEETDSVFGETIARGRPHRNAWEFLAEELTDAAGSALIVSLSSALDCLASVAIGVIAMPMDIKKGSFQMVHRKLHSIRESKCSPATREHVTKCAPDLDQMIEACGPAGWLDWMLGYRNLLIHRGQRIVMHNPVPATPVLAPDGYPARWHANAALPRHPRLGEIEACVAAESLAELTLSEHPQDTLQGIFESTVGFVEMLGEQLEEIWRVRRRTPNSSPQALQHQWSTFGQPDLSEFVGYRPKSIQEEPGELRINPRLGKRLGAAALMDHQMGLWERPEMREHIPRRAVGEFGGG